jgi:hypothetical protein
VGRSSTSSRRTRSWEKRRKKNDEARFRRADMTCTAYKARNDGRRIFQSRSATFLGESVVSDARAGRSCAETLRPYSLLSLLKEFFSALLA